MTDLRKAAEMALDVIIEMYNECGEGYTPDELLFAEADKAIAALEAALAQPEQEHSEHYAEVYIRVGELLVKKVLTQIELSHAYDPIKLLSLVADDCVQNIKELS